MRIFLDETYDRQLKILSYIDNKKKVVSVKQISENTKFSEKSVLQMIRRFEQDCSFEDDQFQVIYANKSIKGIYAENLDLMKIAEEYVKMSILYKMIRNIFLYEKIDVKKFCELEFISHPTFSRYRRKLASILEGIDLKLSRDNQIHGEELKIRNFFFQFFSHSSSEWEFGQQEYRDIELSIYKQIQETQTIKQAGQREISLLIHNSNIRTSHKHYCKNETLAELSQKSDFSYRDLLRSYFYSKKNRTVDQVWNEVGFVELFIYKESLIKHLAGSDQPLFYFKEPKEVGKENLIVQEENNILYLSEEKPSATKTMTWSVDVPAHSQAYLDLQIENGDAMRDVEAEVTVNGISRSADMQRTGEYYNLGFYEKETTVTVKVIFRGAYIIKMLRPDTLILNTENFATTIQAIQKKGIKFKGTGRKLKTTINQADDQVLFTTIPYDKGWKAYLDGKELPIKAVEEAFLAITIPAGKHQLSLVFLPQGFVIGASLFIFCILLFLFFVWWQSSREDAFDETTI